MNTDTTGSMLELYNVHSSLSNFAVCVRLFFDRYFFLRTGTIIPAYLRMIKPNPIRGPNLKSHWLFIRHLHLSFLSFMAPIFVILRPGAQVSADSKTHDPKSKSLHIVKSGWYNLESKSRKSTRKNYSEL